jgi:Fe-S-cluster containining protein
VTREVTERYVDPLTAVWIGAARQIGLRVVRTEQAYAATDGNGTLAIGSDAVLDADDSLAQMILHELCHSLVEGEDAFTRPDWGMDNTRPDHDWREHACLRVQWVLAGRHGLRGVFAPTTEFRAFWDQLSGDVLADRSEPSVPPAILGLNRVGRGPWAPALDQALAATVQIAAAAAAFSRGEPAATRSLWRGVVPPPALHPTGLPARAPDAPPATCETCAWRNNGRCRQAEAKVDPSWAACERYEAALDCQDCGACCRAAYHSVEVGRRDPMLKLHPDMVVDRGSYLELRRKGDRCAALEGGAVVDGKITRHHCTIYEGRPRTCRYFTLGSANCLTARRRVGMSL